MFLGIEIGGTKLQLGVGGGDGSPLVQLERRQVAAERGAAGIREQIEQVGRALVAAHNVQALGIGFGGPVLASEGRVIKSHQIAGWDGFPLADWCAERLELPTSLGNDCDVAALAEARFGAGRGARTVFYVTVGTGVGGGLVIDGRPHGGHQPAVAEIGHLRPGLTAQTPEQTVESIASGRGIEQAARQRLGRVLTARDVAELANAGDVITSQVLDGAISTLGWAIAQVVTLVAPEIVVVGGGLSLIGEAQFFRPLRNEVRRYVFAPLADTFRIAPAALGEQVVVHGALALAASVEAVGHRGDTP